MQLDVCVPSSPLDGSLHLHFSADSTGDTADANPNTNDTTDTVSSTDEAVELVRDGTQTNLYHALTPCKLVYDIC